MQQEAFDTMAMNITNMFPVMGRKIIRPGLCEKEWKITAVQLQVLILLRAEGMLTMSDIAKSLHISNPNVTTLVDRLIEMNFVERLADVGDRRIIRVGITGSGQDFLVAYDDMLAQRLYKIFEDASDEELQNFNESLDRVIATLNKLHT